MNQDRKKLSTQSEAALNYWRNAVLENCYKEIDTKLLLSCYAVAWPTVEAGCISESLLSLFFPVSDKKAELLQEESNNEIDIEGIQSYTRVIVCPVLAEVPSSSKAKQKFIPIVIPALLKSDGTLHPDPEEAPYIPMSYLSAANQGGIILGTTASMERFLVQCKFNFDRDWSDCCQSCDEMLLSVTGQGLDAFSKYATSPDGACFVIPRPPDKSITRQLLDEAYTAIISRSETSQLLELLLSAKPALRNSPLNSLEQFANSIMHLGQMTPTVLTDGQRESLHQFLAENSTIMAVDCYQGPGKNAFLKSSIASLWVRACIDETPPPLIVATSSNSQTITSLIDLWADDIAEDSDNILARRWIPGLKSYGAYCASLAASTEQNSLKYHLVKDLLALASDRDFLTAGVEELLECTALCMPSLSDASLGSVRKAMREKVHELSVEIHLGLQLPLDLEQSTSKLELASRDFVITQEKRDSLQHDLEATQLELERVQSLEASVKSIIASEPVAAAFLAPLFDSQRTRLETHYKTFLLNLKLSGFHEKHLCATGVMDFWNTTTKKLTVKIWDLRAKINAIDELVRHRGRLVDEVSRCRARLDSYLRKHSVDLKGLTPFLDQTLRFKAFCYATHYWEATFLETCIAGKVNVQAFDSADSRRRVQLLRLVAMVTPCLVSSFPSLLNYFFAATESGKRTPMIEAIDLLVVDEASQVAPESAAFSLVLAKELLVLGDASGGFTPARGTLNSRDSFNLARFNIAPLEAQERARHMSAAKGSLLLMAQHCCISDHQHQNRNPLLQDPCRNHIEIANYCNDRFYNGQLIPSFHVGHSQPLPPLCYRQTASSAIRVGGSRINIGEANAIADWIAINLSSWLNHYSSALNTPLSRLKPEHIIGIVSPFNVQVTEISAALRRRGLGDIRVGTPNRFIGLELPIIVFSSAYDSLDNGPYLYDEEPSLLKAAVCAALDTFCWFGGVPPLPATMSITPTVSSALLQRMVPLR